MGVKKKIKKKYKKKIGSRAQVMHGTAEMTSGRLKKKDLKYNKHGRIVSKKKSKFEKKAKKLEKAGYKTKKGQFGTIKKKGGSFMTSQMCQEFFRRHDYSLTVENLFQKYKEGHRPPLWVLENSKEILSKYGKDTKVYITGDLIEEDKKDLPLCPIEQLIYRQAVNIGMVTIDPIYPKIKGSYYTEYFNIYETTPVNLAVYCKSDVKLRNVRVKVDKEGINMISCIGYGFDSENQPDYKVLMNIKTKLESRNMNEIQVKNEIINIYKKKYFEIFNSIYLCALQHNLIDLYITKIGAGFFAGFFSHVYNINLYNDIWIPVFLECLELFKKNHSDKFRKIYILNGDEGCIGLNKDKLITKGIKFKVGEGINKTFFYPHILNLIKDDDLKVSLFVNAWDPHSVFGNGNTGDPSVDGYFGRSSAGSILTLPQINVNMYNNVYKLNTGKYSKYKIKNNKRSSLGNVFSQIETINLQRKTIPRDIPNKLNKTLDFKGSVSEAMRRYKEWFNLPYIFIKSEIKNSVFVIFNPSVDFNKEKQEIKNIITIRKEVNKRKIKTRQVNNNVGRRTNLNKTNFFEGSVSKAINGYLNWAELNKIYINSKRTGERYEIKNPINRMTNNKNNEIYNKRLDNGIHYNKSRISLANTFSQIETINLQRKTIPKDIPKVLNKTSEFKGSVREAMRKLTEWNYLPYIYIKSVKQNSVFILFNPDRRFNKVKQELKNKTISIRKVNKRSILIKEVNKNEGKGTNFNKTKNYYGSVRKAMDNFNEWGHLEYVYIDSTSKGKRYKLINPIYRNKIIKNNINRKQENNRIRTIFNKLENLLDNFLKGQDISLTNKINSYICIFDFDKTLTNKHSAGTVMNRLKINSLFDLYNNENNRKLLFNFLKKLKRKGVKLYINTRGERSQVKEYIEEVINEPELFDGIYGASSMKERITKPITEEIKHYTMFNDDGLKFACLGKCSPLPGGHFEDEWKTIKSHFIQKIIREEGNRGKTILFFDDTKINEQEANEIFSRYINIKTNLYSNFYESIKRTELPLSLALLTLLKRMFNKIIINNRTVIGGKKK